MKAQKLVIAGTVSLALANGVGAQPPGPMTDPGPDGMTMAPYPLTVHPGPIPPRALHRRDLSWIYIDRPRPRKLGVHDIITVIVDEKAELKIGRAHV